MLVQGNKKIGILGAGKIAVNAIINPLVNINNLKAYGIASSNYERGLLFAKKHEIYKTYVDYEALITDPEINIVYIALSNDKHAEWVLKSINASKHVLVEKPYCIHLHESNCIKQAVLNNPKIKFQEGLMAQNHPWQNFVKDLYLNKKYGELVSIETIFTYDIVNLFKDDYKYSYRFDNKKGGGCFYDNSPYWIQLLQLFDLLNYPFKLEYYSTNIDRVDISCEGEVMFSNNIRSTFSFSYEKKSKAIHIINFENAKLTIGNFIRPTYGPQRLTLQIDTQNETERKVFEPEDYYYNQLIHFNKIIDGEIIDEPFDKIEQRLKFMATIQNMMFN